MAQIPQYFSRGGAQPGPMALVDPGQEARGGLVVARAGEQLGQEADREIEAARGRARLRAQAGMLRDMGELERRYATDQDFGTLETRYKADLDAVGERWRGWLGSDRDSLEVFNAAFERASQSELTRVQGRARTMAADAFQADARDLFQEQARIAASDPTRAGAARDQIELALATGVAAGHITQVQARTMRQAWDADVQGAGVRTLILTNPSEAMRRLADPTQYPALNETQRSNLMLQATNREQAMATRAAAAQARGDAVARGQAQQMARDIGEGVLPPPAAGAALVADLNRRGLTAEAESLDIALRVAPELNTAATLPLPDIIARAREARALAQDQSRPMADRRLADARADGLENIARQQAQALNRDPLGAIADRQPEVAAQRAAATTPEARAALVPGMDEAQAQNGVSTWNRRVMTDGEAAAAVQAIKAQGLGNVQAAQLLNETLNAYGAENAPRVLRDLRRQGLPAEFEATAALQGSLRGQAELPRLIEGLRTGNAELERLVGTDKAKEVKDAMGTAMAPILSAYGAAQGSTNVLAPYRQAIETLALQNARTMTGTEAVKRAVETVIGSQFEVLQGSTINALIPRGAATAAQVESTANTLRSPGALGSTQFIVPGGAVGATTADAQQAEFRDSLRRDSQWRMNANGDGVMLVDRNQQPVLRADGTIYGFKFREMPAALRSVQSGPDSGGSASGPLVPHDAPAATRQMFGGPNAEGADATGLDRAMAMHEQGADRDAIWKETGWTRAGTGWRFEISDDAARLSPAFLAATKGGSGPAAMTLGDALHHDALFRAYPLLRQTPVVIDPTINRHGSGAYVDEDGVIHVSSGDKSALLHEVQHVVQMLELGRRGLNDLVERGIRAGIMHEDRPEEMEAIATENRAGLTAEQRRRSRPTFDLPEGSGIARPSAEYRRKWRELMFGERGA